ncbi:MAG: ABC transporter permease [Gemmatimonadota bacterium]
MLDRLRKDLRFALRQMARHPGFSALLVLTIAVAIGGNVAIFSALEGIVLRPLPYPEAHRLVAVWETPEGEGWRQPFTGPDYLDVREQAETLEEFGVVNTRSFNIAGEAESTRIRGAACTASLLELLGVPPLHGRLFTEDEEYEGNNRVVLLSHGLWQEQFGGDAGVVGRQVTIDGEPWEIIGVMPEGFRSPTPWGGRDNSRIWVPLVLPRDGSGRGSHWLGGFGRLAPGVTPDEAEAEIGVIAAQLAEAYPDSNARTRMFVEPMMARTLGSISSTLVFLLVIVGLVLLIACANVGSMLLARGMNRAPEFAMRAAMGAGKRGIMGQLITESLALAVLGGVAGILMAYWGVDAIKAAMPESIPRGQLVQVNLKVLGFASLVTLVTGVLVGVAPSLFASRADLAEVINQGRASRGGGRNRLLSGMVAAQLAIGFVLVNAAVILAVSYSNVMGQTNNFSTGEVLVASLPLAGPAYEDSESRIALYDELLARLRAVPGVEHAGITSKLPLRGGSNGGVLVRDEVFDPSVSSGLVEYTFVGDDYHEAMGIPLLAGRTLDRRDMVMAADHVREDSTFLEVPIVINRAMAERYWPDSDPLGEIVRPNGPVEYFRALVVGVVENVRQWGPESPAIPEMFFPYTGEVWGIWDMLLTVKAGGDPEALAPMIREMVRELDPGVPVPAPYTMARVLEESTAGRRFSMLLVSLFAVMAMILIVAGTYGVVSYAVSQRTHEIGVRMTLGAGRGKVAALFLRRLGFLIGPGLAIGALASWAGSTVTGTMVYGISPLSPLHMAGAGGVMVLVALAATAVPVMRATSVDPLEALRVE